MSSNNIPKKECDTMPPLSLLIKPASSSCNLRCKYCFYHSLCEKRQVASYGMMSLETLENLVKKALLFADDSCCFAFQGGEPTLAGLDFFKKLIEFEKKHNVKNVHIDNSLQTNGIVINEQWGKFLSENKFLVGLSLDGTKEINDYYRVTPDGKGTYPIIMHTVEILNKYKIEYNILSVITSYSSEYANRIYTFFKKNNFNFLQFIPCIDPFGQQPGTSEYSLTPEKYGNFLNTLFDRWYDDVAKGNIVSIRYFDNLVTMAMGYAPEACGMLGKCSCQFVIESDGRVYPCDFYATDEWCIGNFAENSFEEMQNSKIANKFVAVSQTLGKECNNCKWVNLCHGGCRRYREPINDSIASHSYFCATYKNFFDYCGDRIYTLANLLKQKYNIK